MDNCNDMADNLSIKCWRGILATKRTLIVTKSERRAAEILGIPIIKLREWEQVPPPFWAENGVIYHFNENLNNWEEEK